MDMVSIAHDVIAVLIGGLLSIAVAIWAENQRRPKLELSIENPNPLLDYYLSDGPPQRPRRFRALRVQVSNSPSRPLAWMRGPAFQCKGEISFHRFETGENIFGKVMAAQWANSPPPAAMQVFDLTGKEAYRIFDPLRRVLESRTDIYPGDKESLVVVVRGDNDEDCYGWKIEDYSVNPRWKLGKDRFLVKVSITSTGKKCERVFRLINDVPIDSFRLEFASPAEAARIR